MSLGPQIGRLRADEDSPHTHYLNTIGLRHVLIEHIQTNELYVTNDIVLGDNDNKQDGIVLFAVNSSGKTSLIRSLGISIILAQSGCYCRPLKD